MDWPALVRARRRPRAFDPGDGLFWADPYIASHVVWAHLDDRSDDASRPLAQIRREVDWLDSLGPRGRLLDLGCGVGRHDLLLADRGWRVTGLDVALPSLEYARQEAADAGLSIDYRLGDVRSARLPGRQDVILLAYGTLGTLSPVQARRLIARCRRALAPGGRLVFDVFRQGWWTRQLQAAERTLAWDVVPAEGFWAPGPHLVLSRVDKYPELRTFGRVYTIVDAQGVRRFPLWYRWYDPEHLRQELFADWHLELFGGLDGGRWSPRSSWVTGMAQPKE